MSLRCFLWAAFFCAGLLWWLPPGARGAGKFPVPGRALTNDAAPPPAVPFARPFVVTNTPPPAVPLPSSIFYSPSSPSPAPPPATPPPIAVAPLPETPPLAPRVARVNPARAVFPLPRGDVVALVGGTGMALLGTHAHFETLLMLEYATAAPRCRNLAREGDTVYAQPRELNFGGWRNQLERAEAKAILMQFGLMESLGGEGDLPKFVAAYEKLLNEFQRRTPRIALITPPPFESCPAAPDPTVRNTVLAKYAAVIRALAAQRGLQFIDLFTALQNVEPPSAGATNKAARPPRRLTADGFTLGQYGHAQAALATARLLGWTNTAGVTVDPGTGRLLPEPVNALRGAIEKKNRLWFDYWRPMNWAFLHGDRIDQPSSRDHRDRNYRWFPGEVERFLPLIDKAELEVSEKAGFAVAIKREEP